MKVARILHKRVITRPFESLQDHCFQVEALQDYPYSAIGSGHAHVLLLPGHTHYYLCHPEAYRGSKIYSRNYQGLGKKSGPKLYNKVPMETEVTLSHSFQDHWEVTT